MSSKTGRDQDTSVYLITKKTRGNIKPFLLETIPSLANATVRRERAKKPNIFLCDLNLKEI